MSDTPHAANDVQKLLDRGCTVVLFRNELNSYTAVCLKAHWVANQMVQDAIDAIVDDVEARFSESPNDYITDDFTPAQALYRLTEKVFGNIART